MLHTLKPGAAEEAYASAAFGKPAPKHRIPEGEMLPFEAYQLVHDELCLDGNVRLNLATFCQTWLEPQVHDLMEECVDKNVIDKDEYPQTSELESRCAHMLADLWHAPAATHPIGTSTSGSSEAAMLGGLALKHRWQARMKAAGKPIGKPNFVCGPVQICWHKFARYFDVEMRQVPLEKGRLMLTPEAAAGHCDENTIAVVPTLGVTYTLQYEPVEMIAKALDDLERRTGLDVPIHVDAASGGFLAPFVAPELLWDFRLERVRSINASGHKFGLAPVGCGWIVWRSMEDLPEELVFRVNYLGGTMPTFALNFSRPGAQVVAQYYNFVRLGRQGYTQIHRRCAETGIWLAKEIAGLGPFALVHDGRNGIPGATWTIREGAGLPYNLFDLAERVRARGWLVPAYSLPPNVKSMVVQRVLVKNGFSRDMATLLLGDLRHAMTQLTRNPPSRPLDEDEAGSFKHT
jgi:glutamate decarboxylase